MPSPKRPSLKILAAFLLVGLVAACGARPDLHEKPAPLGRFLLGLNVVVTNNMQKGPISRSATGEEWKAALKQAVQQRFGQPRYDGDKYYDMSISVLGYALAPPGIPILFSPKSVLVVEVRFYDDAEQRQLNIKPKAFTVFEGLNAETIIGSGLVRSKKQQMKVLSYNVAKAIEKWLVRHPEWFPATGDVPPHGADGAAGGTAAGSRKAVTETKGEHAAGK